MPPGLASMGGGGVFALCETKAERAATRLLPVGSKACHRMRLDNSIKRDLCDETMRHDTGGHGLKSGRPHFECGAFDRIHPSVSAARVVQRHPHKGCSVARAVKDVSRSNRCTILIHKLARASKSSTVIVPSLRLRRACEGWFWWTCEPGFVPGDLPIGPFYHELSCVSQFRDALGKTLMPSNEADRPFARPKTHFGWQRRASSHRLPAEFVVLGAHASL